MISKKSVEVSQYHQQLLNSRKSRKMSQKCIKKKKKGISFVHNRASKPTPHGLSQS